MKAKLREFWCWLTTGHDWRESDVTSDVLTCDCADCDARIFVVLRDETTRIMHGASKELATEILSMKPDGVSVLAVGKFPENAGTVTRRFKGPVIPVSGPRPDEILAKDFTVSKKPIVKEAIRRESKRFRPRGPGGQFMSRATARMITVTEMDAMRDRIQANLKKRKRGKNGRFVKKR